VSASPGRCARAMPGRRGRPGRPGRRRAGRAGTPGAASRRSGRAARSRRPAGRPRPGGRPRARWAVRRGRPGRRARTPRATGRSPGVQQHHRPPDVPAPGAELQQQRGLADAARTVHQQDPPRRAALQGVVEAGQLTAAPHERPAPRLVEQITELGRHWTTPSPPYLAAGPAALAAQHRGRDPADPVRVGDGVDLGDPAVGDGEAQDREGPAVDGDDHAGGAVHQGGVEPGTG
jgi:hypothetical protein